MIVAMVTVYWQQGWLAIAEVSALESAFPHLHP
jgi:hypothetical protein